MNTINLPLITVQLCEEDRHRLDAALVLLTRIGDTLLAAGTPYQTPVEPEHSQLEGQMSLDEIVEPAPWEPEPAPVGKPTVTHADVQKKVVSLSSADKKAEAKNIILEYAARVSAIPEDKLTEVWGKLTALEG